MVGGDPESLISAIQNDICETFLMNSTAAESSRVLSATLGAVISLLFKHFKRYLKVQLKIVLTSIHLKTVSY